LAGLLGLRRHALHVASRVPTRSGRRKTLTLSAVRQSCWNVLDRIASPLQHPDADIDGEVERLLLAAIDSSHAPVKADGLTATAPVLDHRLRAAITYMREHASDATTAEEVAARVGLSRGHFFALFRDQLNTTPQVFLSA